MRGARNDAEVGGGGDRCENRLGGRSEDLVGPSEELKVAGGCGGGDEETREDLSGSLEGDWNSYRSAEGS